MKEVSVCMANDTDIEKKKPPEGLIMIYEQLPDGPKEDTYQKDAGKIYSVLCASLPKGTLKELKRLMVND